MKKTLIKIWGDVVEAKELIFSIIIITITMVIAYIFAPSSDTIPLDLLFGLGGAVIGFIITVFVFKPKRVITKEDD